MFSIRNTALLALLSVCAAGCVFAQYTPPTFSNTGQTGDYISQIVLNSWTFNMTDRANDFQYNTGQGPGTLNGGTQYTANLTNNPTYGQGVTLFLDLNGDGDYADTNEAVGSVFMAAATSGQITFTCPSAASAITSRMRLMVVYNSSAFPFNPTGTYAFGQCDDFDVGLTPTPPTAPVLQTPTAPAVSGAILVTEVAADPAGSGDEYVEITNCSSGPVDLTGWTITIYDSGSVTPATTPVFTDTITAGTMASGAKWVFCDYSGATAPAFNQAFSANLILGGGYDWGVMLRNNTGVVMDCVFGGAINYAGITSPTTVGSQWSGATCGTFALGEQWQRQGTSDNNNAADWTLTTTNSLGSTNPSLTLPFATSGAFITVGGTDPNFTGTCVVGASLAVSFSATDVNPANTLTFTVTYTGGSLSTAAAGYSTGFPYSPAGGTSPQTVSLAGTAATTGTCNFNIQVGDGTFTDSYTFALTIVAAPQVNPSPTSISVGTTTQGTAGTPSSYTLTGTNFTSNLTVTAPAGVELSQTGAAGTYATTQVVTQSGGNINATIHARIAASAAVGAISANITHSATNLVTVNEPVTGTVNPQPSISVPAGTLALGTTTTGTAGTPASYTVTSVGLTVDITVTAPTGVEISQTGAAGAYATVQTLTQSGGVVNATIHARIAASAAVGAISGNITHASTGATTQNKAVSGTVNAPTPVITPSTAGPLSLGTTSQGVAGTPVSYTVSGANLTADITINAPTGVELSQTGAAGTYAASQVIVQSGGSANATIHARIAASATQGAISGNITHDSTGATQQLVSVTGTVTAPVPSIVVSQSGTLALGTTVVGTAGTPQSYTVTGANLTTDITVTAPTGVELSQTGAAGTYAAMQTLVHTGGVVNATIHARIAASAAVGAISGNITHTSTGATTQNVAVSGTVTPPPPSISVSAVGTQALGTVNQGTAGTPVSYTVTGANLLANITVTAPAGVELSQTGAAGAYAGTQVLVHTGGVVNATIHARIAASAAVGAISGNITHSSTSATTQNVAVSGTVNTPPPPSISVAAGTLTFTVASSGASSAAQSYTVTGTSLTTVITVTAPAMFEVSLSGAGPFSSSISLPAAGGTVFVRYHPTAFGTHNGNITHDATGATQALKAVSGTVTGATGGSGGGGGGGGGGCSTGESTGLLWLGAIGLVLFAATRKRRKAV
jgi:hypothetical protein